MLCPYDNIEKPGRESRLFYFYGFIDIRQKVGFSLPLHKYNKFILNESVKIRGHFSWNPGKN
jgi:hypothetical protein